jgi:hypothetical protein
MEYSADDEPMEQRSEHRSEALGMGRRGDVRGGQRTPPKADEPGALLGECVGTLYPDGAF